MRNGWNKGMDSPARTILLSAIFLTTMVSSYSQKIPIIQGNSLGKWMAARFKDLLIILFTRESQFTTTRRSAWRGLQTKRVQPETYSHPSDSSPGCSNGPLPVFSTVGSSLSGAQSGPLLCQWPGRQDAVPLHLSHSVTVCHPHCETQSHTVH